MSRKVFHTKVKEANDMNTCIYIIGSIYIFLNIICIVYIAKWIVKDKNRWVPNC